VFFRHSSISATDKRPAGGSNNIQCFRGLCRRHRRQLPEGSGDVVVAVKKTTDKPIRYASIRTITVITLMAMPPAKHGPHQTRSATVPAFCE
jgi:hypothetical protein